MAASATGVTIGRDCRSPTSVRLRPAAVATACCRTGSQTRPCQYPIPQRVTPLTARTSRAPPATASPIADQGTRSQRHVTVSGAGQSSQPVWNGAQPSWRAPRAAPSSSGPAAPGLSPPYFVHPAPAR